MQGRSDYFHHALNSVIIAGGSFYAGHRAPIQLKETPATLNTIAAAPYSIAESRVTYTKKDGAAVTVPVVTIYRSGGDLIDDYRVFIDLAPLFA